MTTTMTRVKTEQEGTHLKLMTPMFIFTMLLSFVVIMRHLFM